DLGTLTPSPPPGPSVSVVPTAALPGDTVNITGSGFTPLAQINLDIDGSSLLSTTASPLGAFSSTATVPALEDGEHNIFVAMPQGVPLVHALLVVGDARKGNVNSFPQAYRPDLITNVLFINGSVGTGSHRTINITPSTPFQVVMAAPPATATATV